MNEWSKEQLEKMVGDDIIDQLAFVSGCFKHRYCNDKSIPDGWIISDEVLRKFAKLIVLECIELRKDVPLKGLPSEEYEEGFWEGLRQYESMIAKHFGIEK